MIERTVKGEVEGRVKVGQEESGGRNVEEILTRASFPMMKILVVILLHGQHHTLWVKGSDCILCLKLSFKGKKLKL